MVFVENVIVIKTVMDDKFGKPMKEILKTTRQLGNGMQEVTTRVDKFSKGQKQLFSTTKETTKGMKRFRMELLSVLFFGMAINRLMTGLLKPSLNLVGAFDLLNLTLALLFLPTALELNNVIIIMNEKIGELDESTQKFLGGLVTGLGILGFAMFLFATLGLGLEGIATLFGTTAAVVSTLFRNIFLVAGMVTLVVLLFRNWTKVTKLQKVAIFGVLTALTLFAFALGGPVTAAIVGVTAVIVGMRLAYDELATLLKGTTLFDPLIEKSITLIEKLKDILEKFKLLKEIQKGEIPRIGEDFFQPVSDPAAARAGAGTTVTVNINIPIQAATSAQDVLNVIDKSAIEESIFSRLLSIFRGRTTT